MDAVQAIRTAGKRKTDETRRISPQVRRPRSSSRSAKAPRPGRSPGDRASAYSPRTSIPDAPTAGGNSLHLAAVASSRCGYADVRWGTYRQIQARGGQVRKSERGTRILSFRDQEAGFRLPTSGDGPSGMTKASASTTTSACIRARRPAVHGVQRRAGRRAPGPAHSAPPEPLWKAHQNAERCAGGQWGPRPARGGRPGVLQPEPR